MSRLVLNLAPIQFPDTTEVSTELLEFQSKEQMEVLREEHYSTHVFRREGKQIQCVPVTQDVPALGGSAETVQLKMNLPLTALLINNALLNYLHGRGRKILRHHPLRFIANGDGKDLLSASTPSGIFCPSWLSVKPLYDVDIRVVELDRQPPFVGLAMDVRTTRLIDQNCEELLKDGFSINDLYVGRYITRPDARLALRFELLGRAKSINGGRILLNDARSGIDSIDIKEAFLEPNSSAFNRCIDHVFQNNAAIVR